MDCHNPSLLKHSQQCAFVGASFEACLISVYKCSGVLQMALFGLENRLHNWFEITTG